MSLGKFLNDVYAQKCSLKQSYPVQIVKDIEQSVRELLWRIILKGQKMKMKEILDLSRHGIEFEGTFGKVFPISKLISVGSFYEETRVGDPFEFDFMLLIGLENLEIQKGCAPGLMKIKRPKTEQWARFLNNTFLEVENNDCEYPSVTAIFHYLYEKLTNENLPFLSEEERSVHTSSGILKCLQSGLLHFTFEWNPKDSEIFEDHVISVDTMPAFGCSDEYIENSAKEGDFSEQFLDLVKDRKCYLIPKSCVSIECTTCFHVTFATSENKLIKGMDDQHKKIYSILKHLIAPKSEYEDNLTEVSSYQLKTCLLHHTYESSDNCEDKKLEDCALDILQKLIVCYEDMNMSKFFQRNSSLFLKSEYSVFLMDVLIPEETDIGSFIRQNEDEKQIILASCNVVAWFELTKAILKISFELLIAVKDHSGDQYDFNTTYEPFEDLFHSLDFHFATSRGENVIGNKWIEKLMKIGQQIYVPMFDMVTKHIPSTVFERLEGKICPNVSIPILDYDRFRSDKESKMNQELEEVCKDKTERKIFYMYLVSGWFSYFDGQTFVNKKCLGEPSECAALLHHTFSVVFD